MSIPYRDEQILRILAANTDGMTTGQILTIAKTQRGNELPDSNITSQRIYALRETKTPKVKSIETPAGRIHKITDAGRQIVADLGPNKLLDPPSQPTATKQPPASETSDTHAPTDKPLPDIYADPLAEFDKAAAIMRQCIQDALIEAAYPEHATKIADKKIKLELLEKLQNIPHLEAWAVALIGDIRRDLEQLEAE